jgi:hypothetical protein
MYGPSPIKLTITSVHSGLIRINVAEGWIGLGIVALTVCCHPVDWGSEIFKAERSALHVN